MPQKNYKIEFSPAACRDFESLIRKEQLRVKKKIDALAKSPRPRGCKKLRGMNNIYRIKTGSFRILYQIKDEMLLVLLLRMGDRRDIYRTLSQLK